jgi:hypothetical protein
MGIVTPVLAKKKKENILRVNIVGILAFQTQTPRNAFPLAELPNNGSEYSKKRAQNIAQLHFLILRNAGSLPLQRSLLFLNLSLRILLLDSKC